MSNGLFSDGTWDSNPGLSDLKVCIFKYCSPRHWNVQSEAGDPLSGMW